MKPSKYNICLPFNDKYIVFNGITKRFFLLSNKNKDAFLQILNSPDEYQEEFNAFIMQMSEEGFIIADFIDELEVVRKKYEEINNEDVYKLMILPTYACNVNCWYCTQNHQNLRLSKADIKRIEEHISYYLSKNSITKLQISWFGGEPLLGFQTIEEISIYAKEFCKEHHIEFQNIITTNGILLSPDKLGKMKDLKFSFFQIAIDGTKEEHDKTKVIKGESSYKKTLQNVCLIADMIPEAEISLRFNYTVDNLKPHDFIENLIQYIPVEKRSHIELSLMKVWQENEADIDKDLVNELADYALKNHFRVNVGPDFRPCYVDSAHFNCIFPNGLVDKCDNEDPSVCRGNIGENGEIVWDKEISFVNNTIFTDNHTECIQCRYLPICYGPCPRERDKVDEGKPLKCRYQDAEKLWNHYIIHYCRRFLLFLLLYMSGNVFAQNTDSVSSAKPDSIWKDVQLQGITVKGKNLIRRRGKDIWIITDEMRRHTFNTYDIIGNIPYMYYNVAEQQLYYKNSKNILILIDGKEKDNDYIARMANMRFYKVEIAPRPHGRYGGYDAVINVITKDNWEGYEVDVFAISQAKPSTSQQPANFASRPQISYTYSRPGLNFAAHYDGHFFHDKKKSSLYKQLGDGTEWQSVDEDKASEGRRYNMNNLWIDADYDFNKKHSVSARFTYRITSDNIWKDYLMESLHIQEETIRRISDTYSLDRQHITSLYYRGEVNRFKLYSDFTYNKTNGSPSYFYKESSGYTTNSERKTTVELTQFKFDVTTPLGENHTLNLGYLNYNRWSKIRMGDYQTTNGVYRNRGYLTMDFSLMRHLDWEISGAIELMKTTSSDSDSEQQFLWEAGTALNYVFHDGDYSLRLDYHATTSYPRVFQTNAIEVRIDPYMISKGNPLLKPSTIHHLYWNFDLKGIDFNIRLNYCDKGISLVYQQISTDIIRTYDNVNGTEWEFGVLYNRIYKISKDTKLSLWAHLNYNVSKAWGHDIDKSAFYWTGGVSASYSIKDWYARCSFDGNTRKSISAYTVTQNGFNHWCLSASRAFMKRKLNVGITWYMPISLGITRLYYEDTSAPYYKNRYEYDKYAYERNSLQLNVSYSFMKGHQVKKIRKSQKEESEEHFLNE